MKIFTPNSAGVSLNRKNSIFLAGPSLREPAPPSMKSRRHDLYWREEAVRILRGKNAEASSWVSKRNSSGMTSVRATIDTAPAMFKTFYGTLYIPEYFEGDKRVFETRGGLEQIFDLSQQVEWEDRYLKLAKVILFWIPRDLEHLPGFTTNIEFGEYMASGKVVLGYPIDAPKMKYMQHKADRYHIPVFHTLEETLAGALEML